MSNVIKLNKKNKLNLVVSSGSGFSGDGGETEEEYLERLEEEKKEQIYNAGRETAIREMQEHFSKNLQTKFSQFDQIIKSIDESLEEYKKAFGKIVLDTSFTIAEKIVKRTIPEYPTIISTIKEATSKIIGANSIVLKLNPIDMRLIEEGDEEFLDSRSYSNIKFEVDERIEQGGCLIESEIGNVDARISSQLSELKTILFQEIVEADD